MKVSIVGIVGVPACYGGFESLVENLLGDNEFDITVYCSSKVYKEKKHSYKDAKLKYIPLFANGIQSVFYDIVSLFYVLFSRQDIVLVLGVSGCIALPIFRLFSKTYIVTNIDGLEWKRAKWGALAKLFLKFSEKMAVKFSNVIIADNEAIASYVNEQYAVNSFTIPYGGDHAIREINNQLDAGYALSICRIEPENNVEMILEAFKISGERLTFVGNWNSSEFGINMKNKYSCFANIEMLDPIYDISLLADLRGSCSYYVHGHSAGGTNPSLVEMMHFGKSIICFDCIYNRATTENKSFFFQDVMSLTKLIRSRSFECGEFMSEIAKRRYTWSIVRQQYFNIFNKVIS